AAHFCAPTRTRSLWLWSARSANPVRARVTHSRLSTQCLLHLRSQRAAMLSVGSRAGSASRRRKFPLVGQIFRGNRRGESSWRNSPAKRSTARAAKTDYKGSESLNCRLRIAECSLTHKQDFCGTVGFLANHAPKFQF